MSFFLLSRASRFSSFAQQDSQELLRYLLDSLRSEEIHVSPSPHTHTVVVDAVYLSYLLVNMLQVVGDSLSPSLQRIKHAILTSYGKVTAKSSRLSEEQRSHIKGERWWVHFMPL